MSRTLIGKILAVAVAALSVAFMGFAMATVYGGPDSPFNFSRPDWMQFTQSPDFDGYKIVYRGGENPQWIATRASDEQQVATSALLPQVIVKVMDDIQQVRQQQIAAMREREPRLKEKLDQLKSTAEKDEPALAAHVEMLRTELAKVRQEANDTGVRVLAATAEAQKLENQISLRREDVMRMDRELVELQADQDRLEVLQTQLEDLLKQVEGDLDRAKERHAELDLKVQGQ